MTKAARHAPETRALHHLGAVLEPLMARAFRAAAEVMRGALTLTLIEEALRAATLAPIDAQLSTWPEVLTGVVRVANTAFESGEVLAVQAAGTGPMGSSVVNADAAVWAQTNAGRLIADLTGDAPALVRQLVSTALTHGLTTRELAQQLRSVIGLTARQATAVQTFRLGRLQGGATPALADQSAARYAAQLLRQRSALIARSEVVRAATSGQQAAWARLVRNGRLDPARTRQKWIVTVGACETVCLPMNGQTVRLGAPFVTGVGTYVFQPGAHPACRCALGLVFLDTP